MLGNYSVIDIRNLYHRLPRSIPAFAILAIAIMLVAGLSAILLAGLSLFVILTSDDHNGVAIDGDFSDWDDAPMFTDGTDSSNPNVDITMMSVQRDSVYLSFYVQTVEPMLTGFGVDGDVLRIYIDADADSATGYAFTDLGADYLIEVYGYENRILS